jgi:cleavage and polyadenylation specificity factor subunit 1
LSLSKIDNFFLIILNQYNGISLQIYIWQLKDNDLVGVAFIDTQIYVCQMLSIKSLILVADVYKSVSLLRFQQEYKTLSLVSRVC